VTYLDYIILFQKLDRESAFSPGATRLYLKLLDVANGIASGDAWPKQFAKSDPYMAAVCGCAKNPLKKHIDALEACGLIDTIPGGQGRGITRTYRLLDGNKVSIIDTLQVEKVSDSDTMPALKVSEIDTITAENGNKVSGKVSIIDTPYREEERESIGAAVAASPAPASVKKSSTKTPKKTGATTEEKAALPLPHHGTEFAQLWATFRNGGKQAKKPLSAIELMLAKLGKKPEAFAIVMLEDAIQGDWSGIENGGTARRFEEWQAQQAKQPTAAPTAQPLPTPEVDEDFLAEQQAREDAARAQRLARYSTQPAPAA
jgi:hypothetical protein